MTTTTHEANPARSILGGALFLLLGAAPIIALFMIAAWDQNAEGPAHLVKAVSNGLLTASGGAVFAVAWVAGVLFSLYLVVTEHLRANRAPASHKARFKTRALESLRMMMVILGGAGLIYGSLGLLYAWLVWVRPDIVIGPPLPFSFIASIPALALGGASYALGRLTR